MRKLMLMITVLLLGQSVRSEGLGDLIKTSLIDNVGLVAQYGFEDEDKDGPKMALVDSIIQIGSYKGDSLLDLQLGFFGDTKPEPGDTEAISYIGGAYLRLDPFVRNLVTLPEHWEFLKAIQFGPVAFYDFREKEWYGSLQVGLFFDPKPST